MNTSHRLRVAKLEQTQGRGRVNWQTQDFHQSADNPALWSTSRDGDDFATLAEHEARLQGHWICVCHYRTPNYA